MESFSFLEGDSIVNHFEKSSVRTSETPKLQKVLILKLHHHLQLFFFHIYRLNFIHRDCSEKIPLFQDIRFETLEIPFAKWNPGSPKNAKFVFILDRSLFSNSCVSKTTIFHFSRSETKRFCCWVVRVKFVDFVPCI